MTNVVPFLHIPSQLHALFNKEFGKNIFWELEEQQSENWEAEFLEECVDVDVDVDVCPYKGTEM